MKSFILCLFTTSAWGLVAPISRISKDSLEKPDGVGEASTPGTIQAARPAGEIHSEKKSRVWQSDTTDQFRDDLVGNDQPTSQTLRQRSWPSWDASQNEIAPELAAKNKIFATFWYKAFQNLLKTGYRPNTRPNESHRRKRDRYITAIRSSFREECIHVCSEELRSFCNFFNESDILTTTKPWYKSRSPLMNFTLKRPQSEYDACLETHLPGIRDECDEMLGVVSRTYPDFRAGDEFEKLSYIEYLDKSALESQKPSLKRDDHSRFSTRSFDFSDAGTGNEEKRDGPTRDRTLELDSSDLGIGHEEKRDGHSRTRTRELDFSDPGTGNEEKRDGRTRTRELELSDLGIGHEEKRDGHSRTRTRTRELDSSDLGIGHEEKRDGHSRTRTRELDFSDPGTGNEEKRDGHSRTRTRTRELEFSDLGIGREEKRDGRTRTRELDVSDMGSWDNEINRRISSVVNAENGELLKRSQDNELGQDNPRTEHKRGLKTSNEMESDDMSSVELPVLPLSKQTATKPMTTKDYNPTEELPSSKANWDAFWQTHVTPVTTDVAYPTVVSEEVKERSVELEEDYSNGKDMEPDLLDDTKWAGVGDLLSENGDLMAILRHVKENAEKKNPGEQYEKAENQTAVDARDLAPTELDKRGSSSDELNPFPLQSKGKVADIKGDIFGGASKESLYCLSECVSTYDVAGKCGVFPGYSSPLLNAWAQCADKQASVTEECCVDKCGSECELPFPYDLLIF